MPVISAGNDRDFFGLGTVGSPSTAPDAISVAAVTNAHTFAPALTAPGVPRIAFVAAPAAIPISWSTTDRVLVDVGTVIGTDGRPVHRTLCTNTLPERLLLNTIALISRGGCTYDVQSLGRCGSRSDRRRDRRQPARRVERDPVRPLASGGMVADLDGVHLRQQPRRAADGRRSGSGTTSWRSRPVAADAGGSAGRADGIRAPAEAGPVPPGASILSSTVPDFAGANFAVLDGTSFSAPHVAARGGAAAAAEPGLDAEAGEVGADVDLGAAFADTAGTGEAPVYLEGAACKCLTEAASPRIFSDPGNPLVPRPQRRGWSAEPHDPRAALGRGRRGGAWQVDLLPQLASAGASVSVPLSVAVLPGGTVTFPVVATAAAGAAVGDDFGFVLLRQGGVTRRIPYGFVVTRPRLDASQAVALQPTQTGDTTAGADRVRQQTAGRQRRSGSRRSSASTSR